MRYLLGLVCLVFLCTACDDGDIITVELEFEDTFQVCGEMVFYKTIDDPSESLTIFINGLTEDTLLSFEDDLINVSETSVEERDLNGTNVMNYRRYSAVTVNGLDLFCNDIPSNISITFDELVEDGLVLISTIAIDDDNDGIPWEDEDENLDGDNNPTTMPTDTDTDGVPDYLDVDDDGDNVLTEDEDDDVDGDGNPFTNPRDTDNDGIFDYLDSDDDGDGVETRDEENFTQDNNPNNDETTSGIKDYLNDLVFTEVIATEFRTHSITRTITSSIELQNVFFGEVEYDFYDFGTTQWSNVTIDKPTIFN